MMDRDNNNNARRRLVALVHAQAARLSLPDGEYRAVLFAETGRGSCTECSVAELRRAFLAFNLLLIRSGLAPFSGAPSYRPSLADAVRARARTVLGDAWEIRLSGFLDGAGLPPVASCSPAQLRRILAFLSGVEKRGRDDRAF